MRSIALLLLALLLLAYTVKIYRLRAPYYAAPTQRYRLSYRAALDNLSAHGLRRRYGESREGFAQRLSAMTPSFSTMTYSHLRRTLGAQVIDPQEAQIVSVDMAQDIDWLALDKRIKQEIRQHKPLWRRTLAVLNPVSWLHTH